MSKRLPSNGLLTKLALAVLLAFDWMRTVAALKSSPANCEAYRRHYSPKTCGVVPTVVYFVTDEFDRSLKKTQKQFFGRLRCLLKQDDTIAFKTETIGDGDSTLCSLLDEKRRAAVDLSQLKKFGRRSLNGRVLVAFVHGKSFDRHNCDRSQLQSKLLNNDSFWRPAVVNTIHDDRQLPLDKLKAFFDYQNLTEPPATSFDLLAIFVCQIIRVGRESADRLEKTLADRQLLWAKLLKASSSSTAKRMEVTNRTARTTTATATTTTNATASVGEGDATRSSGSGATTTETDELTTTDDDEYETREMRTRGSVAKEQKKEDFPLWVIIALVFVGLVMVLTLLSAVSLVVRREQGFARAKGFALAGDEKGAKTESPAGQLLVKRSDFALVRRAEQQEEEQEEETAGDVEQEESTSAAQGEAADASRTQSGRSEKVSNSSVDSTKSSSV